MTSECLSVGGLARDIISRDMTWRDMMWRDMTWRDVTWSHMTWWRDVTWRWWYDEQCGQLRHPIDQGECLLGLINKNKVCRKKNMECVGFIVVSIMQRCHYDRNISNHLWMYLVYLIDHKKINSFIMWLMRLSKGTSQVILTTVVQWRVLEENTSSVSIASSWRTNDPLHSHIKTVYRNKKTQNSINWGTWGVLQM